MHTVLIQVRMHDDYEPQSPPHYSAYKYLH